MKRKKKERWYDGECRRKKREVKKILSKCKINKEDTRIYYKAKKEYKKMIMKKIEEEGET